MAPFATEIFRTMTSAPPERVWDALTTTDEPLDHLYGLTVWSDWRPGSVITAGVPGRPGLTGDVLAVDPGRRLSYTLGDRPETTPVYITWEVRPHAGGAVVRLTVDEPDGTATDEIEAYWLPVITGLVAHLDRRAPSTDT